MIILLLHLGRMEPKMDENTQAKFEERLKELLNAAKKKKNVLEYQEISDFFTEFTLEEEQFDWSRITWMSCALRKKTRWTTRKLS